MANKRSGNQFKSAEFKAVIQCGLTAEDAPKVLDFISTPDALWQMESDMIDDGYELVYRYNEKFENYSACAKCVTLESPNSGLWLYGNGRTLHLAKSALLYKHYVIYGAGEWKDIGNEAKLEVS